MPEGLYAGKPLGLVYYVYRCQSCETGQVYVTYGLVELHNLRGC
jgi:hypothetical protein